MQPNLVFWDWNGTLLDDVALCVDALNRLLEQYHYPQRYDLARYRQIFGFPIQDYYTRAGFDFTRDSFADLADSYMKGYLAAAPACPLASGAEAALSAFDAAGVRQVILSASKLSVLEQQVAERGIRPRFDRLLGLSDIYARSKVDIGLAYLAERRAVAEAPPRAVMIGDSVHDFEVAEALGVRCVLVSCGHQEEAQLRATGAPVLPDVLAAAQYCLRQRGACGES